MSKVKNGVTMEWPEEIRTASGVYDFDVEFDKDGDVVNVAVELESDSVDGSALAKWRGMGDAVHNSRGLKSIGFNSHEVPTEALEAILRAVLHRERAHRGPIEYFSLSGSSVGPGCVAAVLPFLNTTPAIRELYLNGSDLGNEEIRLLSEGLNHIRIDELELSDNNIGDEGLETLLLADNSRHLQELDIWWNPIASRGYGAISRFLARGDTEMTKFDFCDSVVTGETGMLVESINRKSKLTVMGEVPVTSPLRPSEEVLTTLPHVLRKTICDSRSIESLCNSNHWLNYIGLQTHILTARDPMLKKALAINSQPECEASVVARCRSKLRAFYFRGQFDTLPFAGMDISLIPFVLELAATSECFHHVKSESSSMGTFRRETEPQGNLGAIYWLLRNWRIHDLFSSRS